MRTLVNILGGIAVTILVVLLLAIGVYGTARVASRGWHRYSPATVVGQPTTIKVECATVRPCGDKRQHTAKRPAAKPTKPAPPKAPVITPKPAQATGGNRLDIHAEGLPAVILARGLANREERETCCQPVQSVAPADIPEPLQVRPTPPTPQKQQTAGVRCPVRCKGGR